MQASGCRCRCGSSVLAEVDRCQQVDRDREVELLGRLVGEHAEVVDARVVDEDVDAAAPVRGRGAEALPVRAAGEIRRQGADALAVDCEARDGAGERGRVAVHEQHARTARQQLVGDGATDAAAPAGDQGLDRDEVHAVLRSVSDADPLSTSASSPRNTWPYSQKIPRAQRTHRLAVLGLGEAREDAGEVVDVLLVELAVAAQVGEGARRQAERLLDAIRGVQRERDAGALEHVHHAEEAERVAAHHGVVGVGDHRLRRDGRLGRRGGRAVTACVHDVVEDPLLVPGLLLEVVQHGLLQPAVPVGQPRAHRHQQRHRVAHVVVGLASGRPRRARA